MAYNAKETQKVIGEVQKNAGMMVRVSRIIPDDKDRMESIDIRQHFLGNDDEWHPTQRGVRVSSEDFPQLLKVLLDAAITEEYEDLEQLGYFVDETCNLGL